MFKNIYSYCKLWNCSIFALSLFKNIVQLFKVLKQFLISSLRCYGTFQEIFSGTQQRNSLRTVLYVIVYSSCS